MYINKINVTCSPKFLRVTMISLKISGFLTHSGIFPVVLNAVTNGVSPKSSESPGYSRNQGRPVLHHFTSPKIPNFMGMEGSAGKGRVEHHSSQNTEAIHCHTGSL